MKYKLAIGTVFSLFMAKTKAQDLSSKLELLKPQLYAVTSFGGSLPGKEFKSNAGNGFYTSTGIEGQYIDKYWFRLSFENVVYQFKSSRMESGIEVNNKGTRLLLGGALDVGYRQEFKKWALYGFVGAGTAGLITPVSTLNATSRVITTAPKTKIYGSLRLGVGAEWDSRETFIPFFECLYFNYPTRTFINNSRLNAVNINIGFKARIKRKK